MPEHRFKSKEAQKSLNVLCTVCYYRHWIWVKRLLLAIYSQSVKFVTSSSNHIANIKIKQKCIKSVENNYKVNHHNDELSKTLMNYVNLLNQTY